MIKNINSRDAVIIKMRANLEKLFLHEKAVDILVKIYEYETSGKEPYPLCISREVRSPYSYISKVLGIFEKAALIESEFEGRIRKIKLTEDGKELAKQFLQIKNLLNRDFLARKRLRVLESVISDLNGKNLIYSLLPVKAELENIKTDDREVLEKIDFLKRKVEEMLNGV